MKGIVSTTMGGKPEKVWMTGWFRVEGLETPLDRGSVVEVLEPRVQGLGLDVEVQRIQSFSMFIIVSTHVVAGAWPKQP